MITKFKCERKSEKDSGRSIKMTPPCKWPIALKCLAMILLLLYNLHILASGQKRFCFFRATLGQLS